MYIIIIVSICPALGRMEELLLEMKQDVTKLSMELGKLPSVSNQLKVDELSILGRLAGKGGGGGGAASSQSIITLSRSSVIGNSSTVTTTAAGHSHTTTSTAHGLVEKATPVSAVKTMEGIVVLPSSTSGAVQYATVQQSSQQTQSGSGQAAYAIGVPSYVDGTTVYLQNQTMSVVPGQQVSDCTSLPELNVSVRIAGCLLDTGGCHTTGSSGPAE